MLKMHAFETYGLCILNVNFPCRFDVLGVRKSALVQEPITGCVPRDGSSTLLRLCERARFDGENLLVRIESED